MYKKCNMCLTISLCNKPESFKCNKCKNKDINLMSSFPIDAAKSFLRSADGNLYDLDCPSVQIDLYNFEGFETTSLFLCTTYEVLLEALISDFLKSINTPKRVSELLISSNQGQWKMGKLFSDLVEYKSMRAVFKEIDQKEFYDKLQTLITTRNAYIHGDPLAFKCSDIEDTDLKYICDSMIDVFVELQNHFTTR